MTDTSEQSEQIDIQNIRDRSFILDWIYYKSVFNKVKTDFLSFGRAREEEIQDNFMNSILVMLSISFLTTVYALFNIQLFYGFHKNYIVLGIYVLINLAPFLYLFWAVRKEQPIRKFIFFLTPFYSTIKKITSLSFLGSYTLTREEIAEKEQNIFWAVIYGIMIFLFAAFQLEGNVEYLYKMSHDTIPIVTSVETKMVKDTVEINGTKYTGKIKKDVKVKKEYIPWYNAYAMLYALGYLLITVIFGASAEFLTRLKKARQQEREDNAIQ